jgi:CheY-like chemotaxis protein
MGEVVMKENNYPTGRRILVADDDEVNLVMILDMLSIHGHKVVTARNGQEAVEMAIQHKPELIFMDIRMPVMGGLEATQRLRAMPEFVNTPIIATTATASSDSKELHIAKGYTAHLTKPFQTKELFTVLKKYLSVEIVSGASS